MSIIWFFLFEIHIKIFYIKLKGHSHASPNDFVSRCCVLIHFVGLIIRILKFRRNNINFVQNPVRKPKLRHQIQVLCVVQSVKSFEVEISFNFDSLFLIEKPEFQVFNNMRKVGRINSSSLKILEFRNIIMHWYMKVTRLSLIHIWRCRR